MNIIKQRKHVQVGLKKNTSHSNGFFEYICYILWGAEYKIN